MNDRRPISRSTDRMRRVCIALETLERQGLLYPALRQLFAMLVFTVESADDPRAESEELLQVMLTDWSKPAATEARYVVELPTVIALRRSAAEDGASQGELAALDRLVAGVATAADVQRLEALAFAAGVDLPPKA